MDKIDKREALELLKGCRDDVPSVRQSPEDSSDFKLWTAKVTDIIRAGLEPEDKETFTSAKYESNVIPMRIAGIETGEPVTHYQEDITAKETALKIIIQKYELLEEHRAIQVPPEEILQPVPPKAFISHGTESTALRKLEEFIEALGITPLIVKKQASLDKDLPDKVNLYLGQASFVIILATGDDEVKGKLQPRQNVIHETGLAQETHPGRIIYLLEEGAEFPSNIRPKVRESFKQDNMTDAFIGIVRELHAYGMLKVVKTPPQE